MSEKPASRPDPWDVDKDDPWELPRDTVQGNGMTFKELQQKYPHDYVGDRGREWKLVRISKRGNRVMDGVCTKGYDSPAGYGGKAYAYYVTAVVRPNGEIAQYTVVYDDWDY